MWQICGKIVGLVVKAPKLAQFMLSIYKMILATIPSQFFPMMGNLAKNPIWPPSLELKS